MVSDPSSSTEKLLILLSPPNVFLFGVRFASGLGGSGLLVGSSEAGDNFRMNAQSQMIGPYSCANFEAEASELLKPWGGRFVSVIASGGAFGGNRLLYSTTMLEGGEERRPCSESIDAFF